MKKQFLCLLVVLGVSNSIVAQRILTEKVNYFDVRTPNNPLDESIKNYNVSVETPYTLTVEELNAQSLVDFEQEKVNYANVVKESEMEFKERIAGYSDEVKAAEERYDKEINNFNKLSLLERLTITEQGKKPRLIVPKKPVYVKPNEPVYQKPNLDDHLIFDNQVLSDNVELMGYQKGNDVLFVINISKMVFQDNGGQTYYSQPTQLKVITAAKVIDEKTFDGEFKFLTSSNSNTINLERYEKNNVNKIMTDISNYINEEFGYIPVSSTIKIGYPNNRKRDYDVLENAKIKAISAYRKLKQNTSSEVRERSIKELKAVREVWKRELSKVDYKNKKALMNKKIGKMIFFNLMRVDLSLKDKAQAEETLNQMQERRIDLDLNYDDKITFTRLEEKVYNL